MSIVERICNFSANLSKYIHLSQTTNSPAHCVDRLRASAKCDCGEEDQTETHHFQQNPAPD